MTEERTEQRNQLIYPVGELVKRWYERFELSRLAILERCLKGELTLHVHTRCRFLDRVAENFCAIFNRSDRLGTADYEMPNVHVFRGVRIRDSAAPEGSDNYIEQLVLIPNIEVSRMYKGWRSKSYSTW